MAIAKNIYTIDNCKYNKKALYDYHIELKSKKCVKNFKLPTIQDGTVKSRFGACRVYINDIKFDSIMESRYYIYLKEHKQELNIDHCDMQKAFILQDKFRKNNKTYLPIKYISDFVVYYTDGSIRVIDIKGKETVEFLLKKKMFEYKYPDLTLECIQYDNKTKTWKSLDEIKKAKRAKKKK